MTLTRFSLLGALTLAIACGDKDGGDDTAGSDGTDGETDDTGEQSSFVDEDGDGWAAEDDCDDNDANINGSAAEVCDGVDNDCDGLIDDEDDSVDLSTGDLYHIDADGDGFGSRTPIPACEMGDGMADNADDCDDDDADINPDATEICDDVDNDCDGLVDLDDVDIDLSSANTYYADTDNDGYGDADVSATWCKDELGWSTDDSDCDDDDPDRNPGNSEVCDDEDLDEDCDGLSDDEDDSLDASSTTTYYTDADSDGFGDEDDAGTPYCDPPSGVVTDNTDCDDTLDHVNPDRTEVCDDDDIDEDCNGSADDNDSDVDSSTQTWYYTDADSDGYGDETASGTLYCDAPSGVVADDTDCDDSDSSINPGVTETWYDGTDSDCAGDNDYDADADGYECDDTHSSACTGTDCDDDEASAYPGNTETWYDGIDGDCAGDNDYDYDLDGFEYDAYGGEDCDDTDADIFPYAWEDDSDSVDNDCDGYIDTNDTDLVTELTTVSNTDDNYELYTPTNTSWSFDFCGSSRTSFYVGSNGQITFDAGQRDFSESEFEFYDDAPIITSQWDDQFPYGSGDIYVIEHSDAIGIYFRDVSDCCNSSGGNTHATILRDDGIIQMSIDEVYSSDGIVGWSCGTNSSYTEVDLSDEIDNQIEDTEGIGTGTEEEMYEYFTGSSDPNDLEGWVWRMCGTAGTDADGDGWTDACGDTDDGDTGIYPQ